MQYKFITILHYMALDRRYNRGIQLSPGIRITNGPEVKSEILETKLMKTTAGVHSIDEFDNKVYYYKSGDLKTIGNEEEIHQKGTMITFYFLREAQSFVRDLWGVKDNGVYIRDGFLIVFDKNIEDGFTFKASLSEVFTDSAVTRERIKFTKEEIEIAKTNFEPFSIEEIYEKDIGLKYPNFEHFYKKNSPERLQKAEYFTMAARGNPAIPMKIVFYCIALECLFSTSTSELSHTIGERVSFMLRTDHQERIDLFKFIKKAYSMRSQIVHGSNLKGNEELLADISKRLNFILKELLQHKHEIFTKGNNDIDDFFINLIFE